MSVLEIKNIEKSFGGSRVLKDISIQVEDGEIVSIIGPSGSGKSTLLRCAAMLETMDRGAVLYEGRKAVWNQGDGRVQYAGKEEMKEIQAMYGLVFQNFNLFPHYSVLKTLRTRPFTCRRERERRLRRKPESCWLRWGFLTRRICIPASFPEASSREWQSPEPWLCIPGFCSLTSPPQPWIRS